MTNQIEPINHLYSKLTIDNHLLITGFTLDPICISKIDSTIEELKNIEKYYFFMQKLRENSNLSIFLLAPDGLLKAADLSKYFTRLNSLNSEYNKFGYIHYSSELPNYIINNCGNYGMLKTILNKFQTDNKIPLSEIGFSYNYRSSEANLNLQFPAFLLKNSLTPLGLAISHKKDDIIKFLLENLKLNLEAPALKFKWQKYISGHQYTAPYKKNLLPEEYILTLLQLAILTKNTLAVETLVEKGASIRESVELICQNEDIRDGKFRFRVPSDRATKTSYKGGYHI